MTGTATGESPGLKLKAVDAEGVAVISTMIQDAIVGMGDFDWLIPQHRFVMLVNRFKWEAAPPPGEPYERVLAGLIIDGVTSVRHRRLVRTDRARFLNLLSLQAAETPPSGVSLTLTFADDQAIRIDAERIAVALEDRGLAWPTGNRPLHDLANEGGAA